MGALLPEYTRDQEEDSSVTRACERLRKNICWGRLLESGCGDLQSFVLVCPQLYNNNRQLRKGTSLISQAGIQLADGSYNDTIFPLQNQKLISDNSLCIGVWYAFSLVELRGPLAAIRKQSEGVDQCVARGITAVVASNHNFRWCC